MKKVTTITALLLVTASFSAHSAFKEFTLDGHSATTYNERGYTLGIEMEKKSGEKIFYANLILPEGVSFSNGDLKSTFSFDSEATQALKDLDQKTNVSKTQHAVSWEIDRFKDSVRVVPTDSELYDYMRRYNLKFNYVDSDGRAKSTQIGLRNSAVRLSELIKR